MARINDHYLKLQASYLFSDIAARVEAWQARNPQRALIRMGIGDVTEPVPQACREALVEAASELGAREGMKGYGPEQGYAFLREAIAEQVYAPRGCAVPASSIFISDGSKCDSANIQELFSAQATVAVPDPVYPVYVDSNVMAGRTGPADEGRYAGLHYLEATPPNGYRPQPLAVPVDLVYLCSPNNPTGVAFTREALAEWVAYARAHDAVLLYDAAYADFIQDPALPRSIYEVEGAETCAIEFRSFSKMAGFTGLRCAWVVVPEGVTGRAPDGGTVPLRELWLRRQSTKFNGASYPIQCAAAAVFSEAGRAQVSALIEGYMGNAACILDTLKELGWSAVGGAHAPYVWIDLQRPSWEVFDALLDKAGIVCTPGAGFGRCGEGHIRLSAFNSRERVEEAMARLREGF